MKKNQISVSDYKERFRHLDNQGLNKEITHLANEVLRTNPNTYETLLKNNNMHKALKQLIKEI